MAFLLSSQSAGAELSPLQPRISSAHLGVLGMQQSLWKQCTGVVGGGSGGGA
jgi:hypothetical protein